MVRFALVMALFLSLQMVSPPLLAGPTCTCKYFGKHLQVGTKICMKSWKGMRVATCGFELNNTSWKISDQKCDQLVWRSSKPGRVSVADLEISTNRLSRNKVR